MDFTLVYFLLSSVVLLRLFLQDSKSGLVSRGPSDFMMGVVMIIALYFNLFFVFLGVMFFVILVLPRLKLKFARGIGAGDLSVLSWVVPGLTILNLLFLPVFLISLGLYGLVYRLVSGKDKVRFVGFIFLANLTCFGAFLFFFI